MLSDYQSSLVTLSTKLLFTRRCLLSARVRGDAYFARGETVERIVYKGAFGGVVLHVTKSNRNSRIDSFNYSCILIEPARDDQRVVRICVPLPAFHHDSICTITTSTIQVPSL